MKYLILDIETIPRDDISESMNEEVLRKTTQRVERLGGDPAEAESLIRSVSPFFGKVLCIGMRLYDDTENDYKDKVICESTEEDTLNAFADIINHGNSRQLKFIHFNGLGFDVPFLTIRSAHYGIQINNRNFRNLRRFSFDSHIDLMMYLSSWNNFNAVSLDTACQSFGIDSPKSGEVKGNTVAQAFSEGNIDAVKEYVLRDVEATYQLYLKLRSYL
ncbi:MAG: ribonuclease H-like domain-containing protein [Candidatus Marinimicrobia bacterium]|nr:ribonuclease H-like domain-containing protein [Candidatus Neomarinimicrobiota bacterium]